MIDFLGEKFYMGLSIFLYLDLEILEGREKLELLVSLED